MLSRNLNKLGQPESRRVALTKRIIKEAVVELLKNGDVSMINVKSICKEAGINRTTFYVHYEDKDQLLNEMVLDTIGAAKDFYQAYLRKENHHRALHRMLDYYRSNSSVYLTLMRTDYLSTFLNLVTEAIWKMNVQWKKENGMPTNKTDYYRITFRVSGIILLIAKWLENREGESTSTMSNYIITNASL